MSTTRRWMFAVAAVLLLLAAGAGMLLNSGTTSPARADTSCAATCNAQRDQCMAASNDRYSCDSQRNQCLKTCSGG